MAGGTDAYAGAARLGREPARDGFTVATGGGPGAMQAANLGAYAAAFDDAMLREALRLLGKAPSFTPPGRRSRAAFEVRDRRPGGGDPVGTPDLVLREISDNATGTHYRSRGEPTPMVLVDRAHWTERLPAWPLLRSLARDRATEGRIALVDRIEQAPEALKRLGG